MIDKPKNGSSSWSWIFPLLFSMGVVLVSIGVNWGQMSRQDAEHAVMFRDMKETDAALATRLERIATETENKFAALAATDSKRDERVIRLEERFSSILTYVQKIDSDLQQLLRRKGVDASQIK